MRQLKTRELNTEKQYFIASAKNLTFVAQYRSKIKEQSSRLNSVAFVSAPDHD